MTPEEKIEAMAKEFTRGQTNPVEKRLMEIAYKAGYRVGIEDAAKVADAAERDKWENFVRHQDMAILTAAGIARAIRALGEGEKT